MPNAATVNIKVTDLTQSVASPISGINFVLGKSLRGPFSDPNEIINSWSRFVEKHGGLMTSSDAPLICKRLLEKGGSVRFCRVGHYTTISDESTLDAVKAGYADMKLIEFDALLITANEFDASINGDAIDTVVFAVDNDTTMQAIADEIESHADVQECIVIENANGDLTSILVIPTPGTELLIEDEVVTGGATQAGVTVTDTTSAIDSAGNPLFSIVPKYPGADGNNFVQTISAPTNGAPGYFNITLTHLIEPSINEKYENLRIVTNTTAGTSDYLDRIVQNSKFFDVVYNDLSALTGQLTPVLGSFQYSGGDDGEAIVDADYIGDSAGRNGFHAFDEYDDSMNIAVLDNTADEVLTAGSAYAAAREDLVFFCELPHTITTKSAMITKRGELNIDSRYTYIFGGGLKTKNPVTGQPKNILGIGDVLALENYSSKNFGPWYSFAGNNRGIITNALGVVNNFGATGNYKDLNDLANQQINMVINRDRAIKLWGNFSAQIAYTQQSQISIVRLIIFLKKSLRPTLEGFLEEPNDIATWKRIYYTVKPFLDTMVERRALFSYDWQGDQFAKGMNDLQINNEADVLNGKYKINLPIKAIPSVQEINLNIILTPAGVDFTTISDLI